MAEITRQIGGRPRQGTLPQARSDEICPRIGTGEGWPGGKFCLAATKICYLWDVAMLKIFLSLSLLSSGVAVGSGLVVGALGGSSLGAGAKGQILVEELNCAGCHGGGGGLKERSKVSPRLVEVGARVNPAYLEAYLRDPQGTKPGSLMPDVLGKLGEAERGEVARELTHFLLSGKGSHFALEAPDAVAAKAGRELFEARGCAACHAPRDAAGVELAVGGSVALGALEGKYSLRSLAAFLRDPLASRPSGRMPDMRLAGGEAEQVAQYLLQGTRVPGSLGYTLYRGRVWEGLGSDEVKAERAGQVEDFSLERFGKVGHHTAIAFAGWMQVGQAGRHAFFLTMNGGSLRVGGQVVVNQEPSDRRGVKELEGSAELKAGWNRIELTYFHTGQEPKFSLEMAGPDGERGAIGAERLSVSEEAVASLPRFVVDEGLAARGREAFGRLGCANCHGDVGVARVEGLGWGSMQGGKGCLSEGGGEGVRFALSAEQRGWIGEALPGVERVERSVPERVDETLVRLNCLACHERRGLGGVAAERRGLFRGSQAALGDQGRLPPPLSDVGAKLTPGWIRSVLLEGKRQRGYMEASMPQFGEAQVGHLVEMFGQVDALEKAEIPRVGNLLESKAAGYEMMGVNGLSCITCHEFNGQKSGEVSALDIGRVTERLQKNWFHLYMRQPSRFHPTVIMPGYWPDGRSIRPEILGGDAGSQIEALWAYLEEGSRAKKPLGLSRQANELRVGDVAELCRGQSPVGYRGIGVGYPGGIHLAFDSGEMALRQVWKGEFARVDLGSFHPLGRESISFPAGIPFYRLKSMEDNWPYKGKTNYGFPQDQGYQFRGYSLDAARRPTFRYQYGAVGVEDFFEDVLDGAGRAYFRRTFQFEAAGAPELFYFRAGAGEVVEELGERRFKIDGLELRIVGGPAGQVRPGSPREVLIPLRLAAGRSTLTLEYQW